MTNASAAGSSARRRIRLIKHLRTHGLTGLERMREDELVRAMRDLKLFVPEEPLPLPVTPTPTSNSLPSSHSLAQTQLAPSAKPGPASEAPNVTDLFDDPHALPRFREPRITLPEGQRSFLRLIPVDGRTLFITWDLSETDRQRLHGQVRLHLRHLDEGGHDQWHDIDLHPGGWYLSTFDDGARMQVDLLTGDDVLLTSNEAVVPPVKPAAPGPVVYATLSPHRSRKDLAAQGILDGMGQDIDGVEVEVTDERGRVPDFLDADLPSSHSLPSSNSLPSSRSHIR